MVIIHRFANEYLKNSSNLTSVFLYNKDPTNSKTEIIKQPKEL